MDANKDGRITTEEFYKSDVDVDGNGRSDSQEIREYVQKHFGGKIYKVFFFFFFKLINCNL